MKGLPSTSAMPFSVISISPFWGRRFGAIVTFLSRFATTLPRSLRIAVSTASPVRESGPKAAVSTPSWSFAAARAKGFPPGAESSNV